MEIIISSFITVTPEVERLVHSFKKEGKDYTLVMTDSANMFITSEFREKALQVTTFSKELPMKFSILHEGEEKEFKSLIKDLLNEYKDDKPNVYMQSNFESLDSIKDSLDKEVKKVKGSLAILEAPKGDVLKNLDSYLKGSSATWNEYFGEMFKAIVNRVYYDYASTEYKVVPYVKLEDDIVFALGEHVPSGSVDVLRSYTSDLEAVPILNDVLAETLGSCPVDYHFRTYVDDGISYTTIFLELENTAELTDIISGDSLHEADTATLFTFISSNVGRTSNLKIAWIGAMLDDILKEEKISEELDA